MSMVFWDRYLDLTDLSRKILSIYDNEDEKQEAANMVDEIIHHKMMGCILDNLDHSHHDDFLHMFSNNPNDEGLEEFLKGRIKNDLGELFKLEIEKVKSEILSIFHISS